MPRRILRWQSWVWAIITPGLAVILANWINIPMNLFPVVALLGIVVGYLLQWQFGDPRLSVNLADRYPRVAGKLYPGLNAVEMYVRRNDTNTLEVTAKTGKAAPKTYLITTTVRGFGVLKWILPDCGPEYGAWKQITLFMDKNDRLVGILDVSDKEFRLVPVHEYMR